MDLNWSKSVGFIVVHSKIIVLRGWSKTSVIKSVTNSHVSSLGTLPAPLHDLKAWQGGPYVTTGTQHVWGNLGASSYHQLLVFALATSLKKKAFVKVLG